MRLPFDMRTILCSVATLLLFSQSQPPDTEVFLATLTAAGGRITLGAAENISKSPGYDNQPAFSPDSATIFFTSARGGQDTGAGQMDIYRFEMAGKRLVQVTQTPESEYSPTVTPDRRHISVIRVEADKTQRLWRFPLAGGEPSLVLTEIKPVGYHAWLDEHTLALFVLGEPATLQIADVRTGKSETVATDIGRSLQRIPGGGVSFVQRSRVADRRTQTIYEVSVRDGKPLTTLLTEVAPGTTEEFVAWTPDGAMLMAAGGALHAWRRGESSWRAVADLAGAGLRGISRLAVSPDGKWIALVGQSAN